MLGNAKLATVRQKCIASQHRKHETGDHSSETPKIIRTLPREIIIANAKVATIREKCIASQDRKRENNDRPSEMRSIMRTVRQKFIFETRKWRPFVRNALQVSIGNAKMATVRQKCDRKCAPSSGNPHSTLYPNRVEMI